MCDLKPSKMECHYRNACTLFTWCHITMCWKDQWHNYRRGQGDQSQRISVKFHNYLGRVISKPVACVKTRLIM